MRIFQFILLVPFPFTARAEEISSVDTSLKDAQKYVLRVDGKPFYMNNIQIRFDNARYIPGWTKASTEAVIAQAAADGFNTLSIPIHWHEVELEKDKFDWSILDEYLELVNKYNIKMEMLWFGTNSGGHTQWLGRSDKLRTPPYVLYSPGRGSKETTSEYNLLRAQSDYSLDLNDNRLRERETYVLSKVMAHIAQWDKKNGFKHPVIGVQIGNEVIGFAGIPFPNSLVISYLSDVAGAVKKSDYVVWTRINCVTWKIPSRIYENEAQRLLQQSTNIDFVGIDSYRQHFQTDEQFVASMRDNLPYVGKNFRMVMETNSNIPNAAALHMAALSGNNAFDYYDFHGLYEIGPNGVKERTTHIADIRLVNKILNSAAQDVATKTHGYGLYVHNWTGINSSTTVSPSTDISFLPGYPTSHGVSINHSPTEIILMSTKGGTFVLPDSLQAATATKGYFDTRNNWVEQGEVQLMPSRSGGASIRVAEGTTVRVVCSSPTCQPARHIYQAEFAQLGGGAQNRYDVKGIGFAGNGYTELPSDGGAYVHWSAVDGENGGEKNIRFRYAHGGRKPYKYILAINGKTQIIFLEPTGSWDTYRYFAIKVPLNKGLDNEIRLETGNNMIWVKNVIYHEGGGNIDELHIL